MKRIAFFPGTFDPFTSCHLEILVHAIQQYEYDVVIIGVYSNPNKNPWFPAEERKAMIDRVIYDNRLHENVKTVIYTGLTIEAAKSHYAGVIICGIRNGIDHIYENQIAELNLHFAQIPTTIINIEKENGIVKFISSSIIRDIIINSTKWPEYIKGLVPDAVLDGLLIREMVPVLRERFVQLFERNGGYRNDALYCFNELLEKYSDPKRYYHGILHLVDLFSEFRRDFFSDPDLVEFALFYHDIEMDFMMQGGVDELNSAKIAQNVVARYLKRDYWYTGVYRFILLTRYPSIPETADEQRFVALDLSILDDNAPAYQRYLRGLRYEYRFLNNNEWRKGRSQFLTSFTKSEYWKIDSVWQYYKKYSVSNIETELKTL